MPISSLTPEQKQLDVDGDGKIESDDLRRLREGEEASANANLTAILARLSVTADDAQQSAFVSLDITLFIRLMEVAREEIQSDEALHQLVERCSEAIRSKGAPLTMDDYGTLMAAVS
jgi:hypothetical protein